MSKNGKGRKPYKITVQLADGSHDYHAIGHRVEGGLALIELDNGEVHFFPMDKVQRIILSAEYTKRAREAQAMAADEIAAKQAGARITLPRGIIVPKDVGAQ